MAGRQKCRPVLFCSPRDESVRVASRIDIAPFDRTLGHFGVVD
jgi:hypothetical protein